MSLLFLDDILGPTLLLFKKNLQVQHIFSLISHFYLVLLYNRVILFNQVLNFNFYPWIEMSSLFGFSLITLSPNPASYFPAKVSPSPVFIVPSGAILSFLRLSPPSLFYACKTKFEFKR
jgi:hypothetical protein